MKPGTYISERPVYIRETEFHLLGCNDRGGKFGCPQHCLDTGQSVPGVVPVKGGCDDQVPVERKKRSDLNSDTLTGTHKKENA